MPKMRVVSCPVLLALAVGPGCKDTRHGEAATDGATGATMDDGSSSGGDDGAGDDVLLDLGAATTAGADDGGDDGCQKIDFLFVIDDSTSMTSHQESLAASFPGFVAAIESAVPASDWHIMVVDSDDDPVNFCEDGCADGGEPVHHLCGDYTCGDLANADACDVTIGAGVVHPLGAMASNVECGVPPGQRWIDASQPDLAGTFACIGRVGVSGAGDERNVTSMLEALTGHAAPGACNDGFLRSDAILVVTLVTNADTGTAGEELNGGPTIESWRDQLLAVKAGDPNAVVVIGFVKDDPLPPSGRKYGDFVRLFEDHGFVDDVFTDDYSALFGEAIAGIAQACEDFVPPG
jgi:hypothetical protein